MRAQAHLVHRTRIVGRDGHIGMRFPVNVLHDLEGALRELGGIVDLPLREQAAAYVADTAHQCADPLDTFVDGLCQAATRVSGPGAHLVQDCPREPVRLEQLVAEFGKLILGDRAGFVSVGQGIREQDPLPGGSDVLS